MFCFGFTILFTLFLTIAQHCLNYLNNGLEAPSKQVETNLLLVPLSGGLPVSIGSGRLSSLEEIRQYQKVRHTGERVFLILFKNSHSEKKKNTGKMDKTILLNKNCFAKNKKNKKV